MKTRRKEFVGRIEHTYLRGPWDYILLNLRGGSVIGSCSVKSLAQIAVSFFGADYENVITYSPPRQSDIVKSRVGSSSARYHPLSIRDRAKFERFADAALGATA